VRIFVAYSYNERDRWVEEKVFPIIKAFGSEAVTGEITYAGPNIPENVRTKIRRSDALLGFTTRRATQDNTSGQTHRWVVSELAAAFERGLRVTEVRERGVDQQDDLLLGSQRIEYHEAERDKCLVEIVKAVGSWHRTDTVRLRLLPEGIKESIRPKLDDPGLTCRYTVKVGNHEEEPCDARIHPITGGLFIDAPNVPRDPLTLIRVSISYGNQRWSSDYESIDAYGVYLS
jgi:hypothetical protein